MIGALSTKGKVQKSERHNGGESGYRYLIIERLEI